jgi:hypothetical protein
MKRCGEFAAEMSTMSASVTSSPNFPGFSLTTFQFFRSEMDYAISFLDKHALQGNGTRAEVVGIR